MKLIKPNKNKGFTLVECLIAIAAFAVLTTMVLMIMATAVTTQKKSSEAEEDLNTLVQNVVEDESVRKYNSDTKTLTMRVGSTGDANFSMTYSTIDGYRNFVKCPGCGSKYNNVEFMVEAFGGGTDYDTAPEEDKLAYPKASYWFRPENMYYECPECGHIFKDRLYCYDCAKTAYFDSTDEFTYDKNSGSFYCNDCKNCNVVSALLKDSENVTVTDFSIGGMTPNAIRYGDLKIDEINESEFNTFMKLDGATDNSFNVTMTYSPNSNVSLPGKYKITVNNLNIGTEEHAKLTFKLPPCYIANVTRTSTSCNGLDGHAHWNISQTPEPENSAQKGVLYVYDITRTGTGSSFWIEFTLTNYYNNNSFDYDYQDKKEGSACALMAYWYNNGSSATNVHYPR